MWINNELRNPDSPGRYVVKTITTTMKNKRKFEALYIGNGKWDVSNQRVTHWLDEDFIIEFD